jgi:hypothetical protein
VRATVLDRDGEYVATISFTVMQDPSRLRAPSGQFALEGGEVRNLQELPRWKEEWRRRDTARRSARRKKEDA